jgi:hypothetical protein
MTSTASLSRTIVLDPKAERVSAEQPYWPEYASIFLTPNGEYVRMVSLKGLNELIEFFRGEGRQLGHMGDERQWEPIETAVQLLKQYNKEIELNRLKKLIAQKNTELDTLRQKIVEVERQ